MKNKNKKLQDLLTSPILIYGAGNFGRDVFKAFEQQNIPIIGFIDMNAKVNDILFNKPIFSPDSPFISSELRQNCILLIGLHNRNVDMKSLIRYLHELKYMNIVTPIEYYSLIKNELGNRFWLSDATLLLENTEKIEFVSRIWEDKKSKLLFTNLLKFRYTGDYKYLPNPEKENQYFCQDLPAWEKPMSIIDCGAYHGEVVSYIQENNIPMDFYAGFEPDLTNFEELVNICKTKHFRNTYLWPCAVGAKNQLVNFYSDGESSHITDKGGDTIICVSLDDLFSFDFHPTLLKMDIEGAEMDALSGARKLISQKRPGLAICIYHRPEHLWEIPNLIYSWELNYSLYLRLHAFNHFEVVVYAIPNRKME